MTLDNALCKICVCTQIIFIFFAFFLEEQAASGKGKGTMRRETEGCMSQKRVLFFQKKKECIARIKRVVVVVCVVSYIQRYETRGGTLQGMGNLVGRGI